MSAILSVCRFAKIKFWGLAVLSGLILSLVGSGAAQAASLPSGQVLVPGQTLFSDDGRYALVMQTDGNLVEYSDHALWSSQTYNHPGSLAVMQTDGNLVVYGPTGQPLWASGTWGHSGSQVTLRNDGNLVINGPQGEQLWSNGVFWPAPVIVTIKQIISPLKSNTPIVGDAFADSTSVPCAPGSQDLGLADGYHADKLVRHRLCALLNLTSSSEESQPGSAYYVVGANGHAIVNARVSGAAIALVDAARRDGIRLQAISSFRTAAHQQALCAANNDCRNGSYIYVAKPGTSHHQAAVALDFAGTWVHGQITCSTKATDQNSPTWRWLQTNAGRFGYHQYAPESWHWDPSTDSSHC